MAETWRTLHAKLARLSEDEVKQMLVEEAEGAKRVSIMLRLHQRFTTLRMNRERIMLLNLAKKP